MEPRKYVKWTSKLRRHIINQWKLGITPISEIARNRKVPRRSIYMLIKRFKIGGFDALEPKKRGRVKELINENFEKIVLDFWKELPKGVHKMWLFLQEKGYNVSERKLQKIFNKNGLKMNWRTRPGQIKYGKYEWPKPNMLWHTDWTDCPFTGKKLIAFIDDNSRFLIHGEYFENATTENTILAFENAIRKYGVPEYILTDQGLQFTPAKTVSGPFTKWCEEKGIKHILGRVHHPQTNGKIERWFGTYKLEYQPERWTLDEFIRIYNFERMHQGINYLKPADKYLKCANNSV